MSRTSAPAATSSALRRSNAATYSLATQRVAWPGDVSSSTVSAQATASSRNVWVMAPVSTASAVIT